MNKLGPAIDVSEAQGNVDWEQVRKSGIKVAIAKVTEGKTVEDGTWSSGRRKAIVKAGLRGAVYHFAHPENNSPREEVEHFIYNVGLAGANLINYKGWREGQGGFFAFLDFEVARGADPNYWKPAWAKEFGDLYRHHIGHRLGLYAPGSLADPIAKAGLDEFSAGWIPCPGCDPFGVFHGPRDWVKFHQYDWHGSVPGVSGDVDRSHYIG